MSSKKIPIAIMASGRGSNAQALHRAISEGALDADLKVVISDQPDAPVIKWARDVGIPTVIASLPAKPSLAERESQQSVILETVQRLGVKFLVLAGYMRVLPDALLEAFRAPSGVTRVVNIHPSLLPAFPGVRSYERAWASGCKTAGVTVHLVESEVDSGPICAQEAFGIEDCTTIEEVEKRGLMVEHRLYPQTLVWILTENFDVVVRPVNSKEGKTRLCVCPR